MSIQKPSTCKLQAVKRTVENIITRVLSRPNRQSAHVPWLWDTVSCNIGKSFLAYNTAHFATSKHRFQRTAGVPQVLSPGRGEQIKGDFAAAAKIGEVHLEANSTVKLAGEPFKFSQLTLSTPIDHGLSQLTPSAQMDHSLSQLTLSSQVDNGPLYEQLIMSALCQPVYDQRCVCTKVGPGKDPSSYSTQLWSHPTSAKTDVLTLRPFM